MCPLVRTGRLFAFRTLLGNFLGNGLVALLKDGVHQVFMKLIIDENGHRRLKIGTFLYVYKKSDYKFELFVSVFENIGENIGYLKVLFYVFLRLGFYFMFPLFS